jgi:nucleotide-binding universal stress UspA family protein
MAIDDHDPNLVVMGTHGHSGIRRRLLGSVTERIVRDAPVPVLTVKSDTEASGSPA